MPLVTIPQHITMNKSEKYILNKLKLLYMSQSEISYLYLEPKINNLLPDFILIDPMRGVMVIEVKAWDINYIQTITPKEVETYKQEKLENPAYKTRRYFNTLQNIFKAKKELIDKQNNLKFSLFATLCFTELKKEDVIFYNFKELLDYYPIKVFYKNDLASLTLKTLFKNPQPIEKSILDIIRTTIFPEIKIIKKKNSLIDSKIIALDIEQERFAKNIPFGHYMVTGLPGSGKSVVLLSRAIHLAKMFPNWNILILTYNKALKSELEHKINNIKEDLALLEIEINNIEITTFHKKAFRISKIDSREYPNKDDNFWQNIVVNNALESVKEEYDAILIDEYQDFYKSWFELVIKMTKEHYYEDKKVKNIFLAGDRLQSIYNPKDINWKQDIGLDMRGRSKLLKKSYRLHQEHMKLGLFILSKSKKYQDEIKKFYELESNNNFTYAKDGSIELLKGEDKDIAHKLKELFKVYNFEDILLLAPSWDRIREIKKALGASFNALICSSKDLDNTKAIFTTYYSAKGIEAKIVLVIDMQEIKERKLFYVALTRASNKVILHASTFEANDITKDVISYVS